MANLPTCAGVGQWFPMTVSSTFHDHVHHPSSAHSLPYPSPPPDSMSSLSFCILLHHQPQVTYTIIFLQTLIQYPVFPSSPHQTRHPTVTGHCSICISLLSSLLFQSIVLAHVSLPYTIALLTQATYTFPFSFSNTSFLVRIQELSTAKRVSSMENSDEAK